MLMSERETECECRRLRIYRLLVGMIGHPFGVDKWVVSCNQIVVVWRCLVNVSMFVRWKAGMVYPYLSASGVRFSRRGARSLPLYGMHNTISGWSAYAHQRYSSLIFLIERIRGFTRMRYTNLLTYLFTYLLTSLLTHTVNTITNLRHCNHNYTVPYAPPPMNSIMSECAVAAIKLLLSLRSAALFYADISKTVSSIPELYFLIFFYWVCVCFMFTFIFLFL